MRIVRSRAKIEATIGGARAYLAIEDFSAFVWGTSWGKKPIQNRGELPHAESFVGGNFQGAEEARV